ncbi:MAG: hypothetical protein IT380_00650 [Myxococcales bacterium]|nr:hypothetical protein [Myxococcales bacterium]
MKEPKDRAPSLYAQIALGLLISGLFCSGATFLYLRSTLQTLDARAASEGTDVARDAGCWKAYGTFEGPDYVITCVVPDAPEAAAPACAALHPTVTPFLDGGTGRVRVQRLSQYPSGRVLCEDRLGLRDGG